MDRLIARELMLSARRTGLWSAVALHAAVSLAFLEAWSGRVELLSTVQAVFLLLAAPWVAARIATPVTAGDLPRMAMLFAVNQSDLIRARATVTAVWVLLLCAAGWPAAVLGQQMSAIARRVWLEQGMLFAGAILAAAVGVAIAMRTDHAVTRWLAASGVALALWMVVLA